jgi:hypothetical protein
MKIGGRVVCALDQQICVVRGGVGGSLQVSSGSEYRFCWYLRRGEGNKTRKCTFLVVLVVVVRSWDVGSVYCVNVAIRLAWPRQRAGGFDG